ncbi:hypothetical protein [Craterilacuibacter sp. RT1T]|uniref:hypothetical protein n=1 Tax=Craterilacuibacter sp. RT1T TaxID=2942211 RepID=UPI0020C08476|nr:hypothetical protein [Craterilacuibacter sp. RT1T]MCL6262620.1 hypothetical protein [Craterilacuibacter sp. RT1T]
MRQLSTLEQSRPHKHAGLICLEASFTGDATAKLFREQLVPFRKQAICDDVRLLLDAVRRSGAIACF